MKHGTQATIIADSVSTRGHRLTTMEVVFPRYILPEVLTHRAFSRNTASSRALPTKALLDHVHVHGYLPQRWFEEAQGMAPKREPHGHEAAQARDGWIAARKEAIKSAHRMLRHGVHHSQANRLLEPYSWTTMLISSTEWNNFFAQRLHPDADSEMYTLAGKMKDALLLGEPTELADNEWHTPYAAPQQTHAQELSVARCARVSYVRHDGTRDPEKDLALFRRLRDDCHPSPFEHVARPSPTGSGNFVGWTQLRSDLGL